jgi:glycosyltransferase involved in cell wall biosynthesis
MKIWIVSEPFYPEEVSTGYVMTKLAEKIAEDADVEVICGPSKYDKSGFTASYPISKAIKIHRATIPQLNKNKLIARLIKMFLLSFKMVWKILVNVKKDDKVILVTNPALLLIFVSLLKKVMRFNYIVIVHDVFPENMVPAEIIGKKSLAYKFLIPIFNMAYNSANQLVVVGEDMKKLVRAKVRGNMQIDVIQNWADSEEIYPIDNINTSEYYNDNFKNKIIIQFAGNIGRVQGLDSFLNIFKDVNNPNLVFLIIGEGALKDKLKDMQVNNGIKNIYFYSAKPRSEQLQFINACDIGLVTLSDGMYGLGVPSKTYNILSAAKPILYIGENDSEISLYIKKASVGWSFTWNEVHEIKHFLNSLNRDDIELIREKGKNAYQFVNENFTKEIILDKYKSVLI